MGPNTYARTVAWLARNVANRGGAYMERSSAVALAAHLTKKSVHDVIADVNLAQSLAQRTPERPRRSVAEVLRAKRKRR